jgi:hypothetical protein
MEGYIFQLMTWWNQAGTLSENAIHFRRREDWMTTQMLFTLVASLAGLAGIAYGLWVIGHGQIKLQRGVTTETITGRAAQRIGILIVIGAMSITLVNLLVLRPLF